MKHHLKAAKAYEQSGMFSSAVNCNKLGAFRAQVMTGNKDIELQALYGYIPGGKVRCFQGMMRRYIAEILLNIGDQHLADAEDWAEKAIHSDKKNDMQFRLGQDYVIYAEVFQRKGDQSKARNNLSTAIEIFKQCGADGWVEKYEKQLKNE